MQVNREKETPEWIIIEADENIRRAGYDYLTNLNILITELAKDIDLIAT